MAETILTRSSNEQFKDDYTRYALYTTYKRVLSDMRDGLKPVQRRILYTMFKNTGAVNHTVKSAAVVGDVMKYYHPHSNCLRGNTKIQSINGCTYTIKEAYEKDIFALNVYVYDTETKSVKIGEATNFRIGKITNEVYHIKLSNGYEVATTGDHRFLTDGNQWIEAKDITTETKLFMDDYDNEGNISVESTYIEKVDNEQMYDFTVLGYENMLIPIYDEGEQWSFICVHNSGIYGAIKPMVNWFESKIPILDSQGSFGNLQGDPAAAERYTEVKLSKFAMDCVIGELADTDKSVDWIPNYSNTTFEPEFLPCKIPLLLVEGSLGIGVGLRADIPSHNLNEVIDATISLMHDPNQNVILIPDHCMPCYIYNTDWEKISKTGFGHYKIRGIIDIEDYKNKKALVIKSVPDLTFLDTIKYKLEELVEKKKIIQIENMFDECTIDKMRFVIVLKNGADPDYVREVIYKNTKMEQTLRINLETLYGFNPLRMSYKSYLLSFIDFRKNTKFRLYTNILQDVQTKIHEREAYIRVLESGEIDNIIKMIKKQKTVDDNELISYLMKKLKITDLQAKYIINADLRKLSIGYLNKYKEEAKNYEALRQKYMSILMDERLIEAEIEQELLDIKAKYGKPRTCKLITGTDDDVNIPRGMMQIAVTEKNFIRKVPEGTAIGSFRNDTIRTLIRIDNIDSMLIFDEQGRVFKLPVHKIPFTDRNSNGIDIRFMIKGLTANINCIIPESVVKELAKKGSHNNKHYLITITRNGLYKRMDLDDFCTVPPSGILYAKLEQGDFIKDIIIAHSNFNIIVYSDRKAVSVNVNDIPYLKRNTKGSKSIYNADVVDGLCVIDQTKSDIIVITDTGKINRIPIMSLPIGQNKKGFNVIKLGANDNINSIVSGNDSNIICVKTVKNYYEIPVSQLTIGSSISGGEKLVPMKADQMIRCWIK